MGPEMTGVFAMKKDVEMGAFQDVEMQSFVRTLDADAVEKLDTFLTEQGLEQVGEFKATGCEVYETRTAPLIGRYVAGSVFRVGHGASSDILPEVIHDPQTAELSS